jgi:acyl-CoA thioesterase I
MRVVYFALAAWCASSAFAAEAQVVALGASNTRGYDLPLSEAWPAKLEALLRKKGYPVNVSNQGINGDTSDGMLSRLSSAVPADTRVVILECCGNDNKGPRFMVADHVGNIRTLVARLRATGAAVVFSGEGVAGQHIHDNAGASAARSSGASWCGWILQGVPEGHINRSKAGNHADAVGQDIIAARMLPCVIRSLGRKG